MPILHKRPKATKGFTRNVAISIPLHYSHSPQLHMKSPSHSISGTDNRVTQQNEVTFILPKWKAPKTHPSLPGKSDTGTKHPRHVPASDTTAWETSPSRLRLQTAQAINMFVWGFTIMNATVTPLPAFPVPKQEWYNGRQPI